MDNICEELNSELSTEFRLKSDSELMFELNQELYSELFIGLMPEFLYELYSEINNIIDG